MARSTEAAKARVLTPDEIELAEQLQKALSQQAEARVLALQAANEVSRLTTEINKLGYTRSVKVWSEAREKASAPPAATREDLLRR